MSKYDNNISNDGMYEEERNILILNDEFDINKESTSKNKSAIDFSNSQYCEF